jgi:hypothetical protein
MQYALLIYSDPDNRPTPDSPESQADFQSWMDYSQALRDAGIMRAGEALHPVESATTVSGRSGEVLTTDGPFAETKEVFAGFYLIDVPDLDAALEWAGKMPNMSYGCVEVRPTMVFDGA